MSELPAPRLVFSEHLVEVTRLEAELQALHSSELNQAVMSRLLERVRGLKVGLARHADELAEIIRDNESKALAIERLSVEVAQLGHRNEAVSLPAVVHRHDGLLRKAYRRLYRLGGSLVRRALPTRTVMKLRALVPSPDGIPKRLEETASLSAAASLAISSVGAATDADDVFVFSIINWNFRFQRPQHLAAGLSARHRVFYVEMELTIGEPSIIQERPNLYVVRIPREGIGDIATYNGRPTPTQVQRWLEHFFDVCDAVGATSRKHVIVEHPFWWQFAAHLPPDYRIIVDCMDEIAGFSNTMQFLLDLEREMIAVSNGLIVSSQYLFDKLNPIRSATLVRNGAEISHFSAAEERRLPPRFLPSRTGNTIRVGYVGAIAEWFDVDLVHNVATAANDIEFHLCGAVTNKDALRLEQLPNVRFYGEVPYADLPAFLDNMDVVTIPFQLLPIIRATDPVKFYEYSAARVPTVSTRLPELKRAESLVFFADDPPSFLAQIYAANSKRTDMEFLQRLADYASANTWDDRVAAVEMVLAEAPKVSVVILAFGDPGLTEVSLGSLFAAGGRYPNLDVIVVDNGSKPRDLDRVRKACARHGSVRLIENGQNLGFAKGNNIGIQAATGDFVLLLNNDVYIPPGAIDGMVDHLSRNPQLGAVGPLTNNIGNEAKVEIAYSNMQEMEVEARKVTMGYRGQWTALETLAYFAVMFRRRDLLEVFGELPEHYGTGMFEDDDHCRTIRSKGMLCGLAEDSFVHHHLSASFDTAMTSHEKTQLFLKNKDLFEERWGSQWLPHKYRQARPPSRLRSR